MGSSKSLSSAQTWLAERDERELVQFLSLARLGLGVGLWLLPGTVMKVWTGDEELSAGARLAVRGLAARDIGIAVGTLVALDRKGEGPELRGWLEAGVLADASDALSTLGGWAGMPPFRRLLALATSVTGVYLGVKLAQAQTD